jgi:hypothetical protein
MDGSIKVLKPDLKVAIRKIEAKRGDVLLVCPDSEYTIFTAEYVEWLQANLPSILPPGVRAIIVPDSKARFERLKVEPVHADNPDLQKVYAEGWQDAFAALEDHYSRAAAEVQGQGDSARE